MHNKLETWIDALIEEYRESSVSCRCFEHDFQGFFSSDFLLNSYYVVVAKAPKPDFPELFEAGMGTFIDMPSDGITYKDTYFIESGSDQPLSLHFHELVHVAQWRHLGAKNFITKYIAEYNSVNYRESPLEKMAYDLQDYYSAKKAPFDIFSHVQGKI